ncbi:MAG TPA: hypothetical protein PLM76_03560 [Tenuifilaceae bacterium]|nr:hypothetical protein [Tenuifilaceae bacterium]
MLFFEPGAYEEFIYRLSALKVKPPADSWESIDTKLQLQKNVEKKRFLSVFFVAATILTLIGLGATTLVTYKISTHKVSDRIAQSNIDPRNIFQNIASEPEVVSLKLLTPRTKLINLNKKAEPIGINSEKSSPSPFISLSPKPAVIKNNLYDSNPSLLIKKKHLKNNEVADTPKQEARTHNWSVNVALAPSYSYHTAGVAEANFYSNERGTWMWSGEILAKRKVSRRFSIFTGISVSPVGQTINNILLLSSSKEYKQMEYLVANTTYGWVSLDNHVFAVINSNNISNTPNTILKSSAVNKVRLSQHLHYLEIPIILSYGVSSKHTQFDFKVGYAAGLLISNRFIIKDISKRIIGETEGVNRFNSTAIASVCFSAPISRNVRMNIEPTLKIGLQPLKYGNEVTYPFSTSVKFGVNYCF